MNKVVLITGASSGIGLCTAEYLSDKGYKVYGVARRQINNEKFTSFMADVNNHEQIKNVFEKVQEKEGKIDVVINNAGMGISGAIEFTDKQSVNNIFNTNVVALIDVCSLAIPYLRQSKGKIINIGSVAGPIAIPFQACYSATKSAVETFSSALGGEVKDFNIKVVCIRPGDTKTGFTQARHKIDQNNDQFYKNRVEKSVKKMEKDEQNGMSTVAVSKLIHKAIKKRNPAPVMTVGLGYKFLCLLAKLLPLRMVNYIVKKIYG